MPSRTTQRARNLRSHLTDAEQKLWHCIRRRQLAGARFRRQHPIGRYITDFACLEYKLVIEIDGGQHAEHTTYDAARDAFLCQCGYTVLRYWNHQVLQETEAVLEEILCHLTAHDAPVP
jgi:adenine-specific DNA-methyltransferase